MHEVLVNCLGCPSLPRTDVFKLADRPDMTSAVNCGRQTTTQQQQSMDAISSPELDPVEHPSKLCNMLWTNQMKVISKIKF